MLITHGMKKFRLGDLGAFRNGVNFERGSKGTGLCLINVKDIFRDSPKVDFTLLDKVDLGASRSIDRYFVEKGDIFFVRSSVKRDGIGYVVYSEQQNHQAVHCGFVIRFRHDSQKVNPIFLTYSLRSPRIAKGSGFYLVVLRLPTFRRKPSERLKSLFPVYVIKIKSPSFSLPTTT